MTIPRMSPAAASASAGVPTTFTPPALPRPPVATCALSATLPPSSSAARRASPGAATTRPSGTGMPQRANSSLPWCSNRSNQPSGSGRLVRRWTECALQPVDDRLRVGSGREDLCDAGGLQRLHVFARNDATTEDRDVAGALLPQQLHDPGEQHHVGPREAGQADGVGVLLERGLGDLLRGLVQPGV